MPILIRDDLHERTIDAIKAPSRAPDNAAQHTAWSKLLDATPQPVNRVIVDHAMKA